MIEDLVAAAVNQAIAKGKATPRRGDEVDDRRHGHARARTRPWTSSSANDESRHGVAVDTCSNERGCQPCRNSRESVSNLIDEFAKLPGIGKKSAERLAYHVLRVHATEALALADAIRNVKENVRYCRTCYNLAEEEECAICRDPERDQRPALRGRAAAGPDGPGADGRLPGAVPRAAGTDCPAGGDRAGAADHRRPGRAGPRRGRSRR